MRERHDLSEMDIKQAVLPPNGNGLATVAFTPRWGFLSVFGWKHVEEGVEAWVCDGEVLPSTTIARDLRHIIGHKQFVRRVILHPEPLRVEATAKTSDLLDITLEVSIAYSVVDAVYVAATSEPLVELQEAARGVIMEFAPSHTLLELIQDDSGDTRRALQDRLNKSTVFSGHYAIEEVLSVAPKGDSRLIDIATETRLAEAAAALIEQEGLNQQIAASHELQIEQERLEQEDEFKQRDHERLLESERLKEQGATARAALEAVGQLGRSGVFTPEQMTKFLGGTRELVGGNALTAGDSEPGSAAIRSVKELTAPVGRTVADEEEALESIAQEYGILEYHVFHVGAGIGGASVKFRGSEITFTTDASYPLTAPIATVTSGDGSQLTPAFHWFKGRSTLADAVLAILAKLPSEPPPGGEQ